MAKDTELSQLPRGRSRGSSYEGEDSKFMSEREWSDYNLRQIQKNLRSGLTAFDDSTNAGYFIGWFNGYPAFVVGDRSAGNFIEYSQNGFNLGANTTVEYGNTPVSLAFGVQTGEAGDGDTVTFSPEFATVPKVIFGQGGITYDSTLGSASDQTVRVQPVGLTTTGFTMKAKISDLGTPTAQSFSFATTTAGEEYLATKTASAEAYDDNYTVNYSVSIPATAYSAVTVEIYARASGGSFSLHNTQTFYHDDISTPASYNIAQTITVDGLGANSEIKVVRASTAGTGGTISASDVDYSTNTITERSKTPAGASKIPWIAIATS